MGEARKSREESVGRSFLTVGTGEMFGQVAVLIRGMIITRLIGLEQMGVVATILILVEFLTRMTNLNPSITMMQDKYGASRGFRHTLQAILLIRGALFCVVLALLAWPLSIYYQQEPYLAGFLAVALIPLLTGLTHVDVWRQLRKREYKPQAKMSAYPKIGSLLVTLLACIWIQNFWLPIIARISGAVMGIIVSFKLSKRRFGLAFGREHVRRIVSFILPLMGAGILIYFSSQGTTFFIASGPTVFESISVEQVTLIMGILYVAMRLCTLPDAIGSKLVQSTWAPRLASAVKNPDQFRRIFTDMQTVAYLMAAATILLLGAGTTWITIIYGNEAAAAGPVVALLSIYSGLRLGRVAMRAAALSSGRSGLIFWANLASAVSIIGVVMSLILVESADDKT